MKMGEDSAKEPLWWRVQARAAGKVDGALDRAAVPYSYIKGPIMSGVYFAVLYDMSYVEQSLTNHMRCMDEEER